MTKTPVVLFAFNRPDITQRVFDEIRNAKPEKLFLVVDGPRNSNDQIKIDQIKKIIGNIDWECEVFRDYSETNMGCAPRISSGIDWVFQHVDRAIFFEDDCLPHQSFFRFCDELLEKYRDDAEIMHISGDNFQHGNRRFECSESYYFSRISQSWGWATWKRAWQLMDKDMKLWPKSKQSNLLNKIFLNNAISTYWTDLLEKVYSKTRMWDGQWTFTCFVNNGLCIMPKVNLVSNIGFGEDATHTKQSNHKLSCLPTYPIEFPLIHPIKKVADQSLDNYTMKWFFGVNDNLRKKIKWYAKSTFPNHYGFFKKLYHKYK